MKNFVKKNFVKKKFCKKNLCSCYVLVEVLQAHWWAGRTLRTPLTCRMAEQAHIRRVNKESNLKMAKQFVDTNTN